MSITSFPNAPQLLKAGLVLLDADSGAVQRVIALQYNPDTLTRTLQPQGAGGEGGDRSEPLRLKGPPVETIKLEAEIDATDQLESPSNNPNTVESGIQPHLAALETIVYPASAALQRNALLAALGTIEIISAEAPLTIFVWSKNRVLPVRLTEFSITEEAFDPSLNPIRAKVSLGIRVLGVNDVSSDHRAAGLYMSYQQQKEKLAALSAGGTLTSLGMEGIG
jgi:hypothetical protein